jgi:putative toxin-antitoxin system antitoxin component (TIGR02293 family)
MTTAAGVLGGSRVLGRRIRSNIDFHYLIVEGIPLRTIAHIKKKFSLSDRLISQITGVSPRTISRRWRIARPSVEVRLSLPESDRLYRFARIIALACNAFHDKADAIRWLKCPQEVLDGCTPLDLIETYAGACVVQDLLWLVALHIGSRDNCGLSIDK